MRLIEVQPKCVAGLKLRLTALELADAKFRALHVRHDAYGPFHLTFDAADDLHPLHR